MRHFDKESAFWVYVWYETQVSDKYITHETATTISTVRTKVREWVKVEEQYPDRKDLDAIRGVGTRNLHMPAAAYRYGG